MYKLVRDLPIVLRTTDNHFIPFSEDNTDYVAYLAWLADGNAPQPPDEVVPPRVKVVSAAQGGIALIRAGLMKAVQDAANDPTTPPQIKWAFDKASEWDRDSEAFNYLAAKAGISEAKRDELFASAALIVA